ncbi:hypothetical protein BC830DRAFT_1071229 [Chytriomyces sp. MP71]|nr:hypothetical protein BC830DRAFT_1071229 [Chytriomyces sp. MP71]
MYLPTEPAQDLREDGSRPSQTGIASVPSLVVFSGGSAANAIVSMLKSITHNVAYVMPVSDDGGSTSEIVKVVGGPGIGDIRSRLVRLSDTTSREAKAVYELLSYRLPATQPQDQYETSPAKIEWLNILEGNHRLWAGISLPYRETIRAFLLQFHYKILQEIGGGGLAKTAAWFEFRGGSVGNFFLSGCRLFFDSLEAAVFQFARVTRCPPDTQVLPIVATAHNPVAIGVSLRNGSAVHGQCEISHPGTTTDPSRSTALQGRSKSMDTSVPDSGPPASLNTSSNLFFSKGHSEVPPLPSPIRRVFYINSELAETFPKLNTLVPEHLETKKSIIYSMGSLYTSLLPCLVVAGVGSLIAQDFVKILLLNGTHDRETAGYTALDFILAITDTLNYSVIAEHGGGEAVRKPYPPRAYITHVLYADDGEVDVDVDRIDALGIRCMVVPRMGSMEGCERKSASELLRMAGTDVKRVRGHFGTEELRSVLEPILL